MSQISDLVVRLPPQEETRKQGSDAALRAADANIRNRLENPAPSSLAVEVPATPTEAADPESPAVDSKQLHKAEELRRVLDELEAQRHAGRSDAARPAQAGPKPTFGLEPRYWRQQRQERATQEVAGQQPAAAAGEAPRPAYWADEPIAKVDRETGLLRQRVLAAVEPERSGFPMRIALPIVLGLSALLLFKLDDILDMAATLSDLF